MDISNQITATFNERSQELEQEAEEQRVTQLEARVQEAKYQAERVDRRSYSRYHSFYNYARPSFGYRLPTSGQFGFAGQPIRYHHGHRARSSATYQRVDHINDCNISSQSGSLIVSSGFNHGSHFQRQPVPPPVRFPTFFAPELKR